MNACGVHFGAQAVAFFIVGAAFGACLIFGLHLWRCGPLFKVCVWQYGISGPTSRSVLWLRSETVARESVMETPPSDAYPGDFPATLWRRRMWSGRVYKVATGPEQVRDANRALRDQM